MDQFKRVLKLLESYHPAYRYRSESDSSPMSILMEWVSKTDHMKSISVGMLKDWFEELEELENEMIDYYRKTSWRKGE